MPINNQLEVKRAMTILSKNTSTAVFENLLDSQMKFCIRPSKRV